MIEIKRYKCELCGHEFKTPEAAIRCEKSPMPRCRVKIGDEVKLGNRSGRSYTLAKVVNLRVQNLVKAIGFDPEEWLLDSRLPDKDRKETHRWLLELDREVCLDANWEGPVKVLPECFVLSEEESAGMERKDNDCW